MTGHASLAYSGNGVYTCQCGQEFATDAPSALQYSSVGVQMVQEAWDSHKRDVLADASRWN